MDMISGMQEYLTLPVYLEVILWRSFQIHNRR